VRWYSSSSLRVSRDWIYFTWAEMESCSSVGREAEAEARPGPDTRDILVVIVFYLVVLKSWERESKS